MRKLESTMTGTDRGTSRIIRGCSREVLNLERLADECAWNM